MSKGLSIAVFLLAAIAVVVAYTRRMQSLLGYSMVGVAGFVAPIIPSFYMHDWFRGVGMGVSVATGLILGLRVPYPRPGGSVRAGGRVGRLDRVQLAELILIIVAATGWTFAPDSFLPVALILTVLALLLLGLEPLIRRGEPQS